MGQLYTRAEILKNCGYIWSGYTRCATYWVTCAWRAVKPVEKRRTNAGYLTCTRRVFRKQQDSAIRLMWQGLIHVQYSIYNFYLMVFFLIKYVLGGGLGHNYGHAPRMAYRVV